MSTAEFIGAKSSKAAEAKLLQEDPDLFTELGNSAAGGLADGEKPTNCRKWRELRDKGYVPSSDLGQEIDDAAKVLCRALELLSRARPAQYGFVRSLTWDSSLLGFLPSSIHPQTSPLDRQQVQAAVEKGRSYRQFRPAAKFKRVREELAAERFFRVDDPEANSVIVGQFLAYADVDRDGAEDLLLSVINLDAESEAFLEQRIFALTRTEDREVLKVISSD